MSNARPTGTRQGYRAMSIKIWYSLKFPLDLALARDDEFMFPATSLGAVAPLPLRNRHLVVYALAASAP